MDAAQKLLKTAALLSVIALLMAAPGWAQTLVVPTSITIGGTGSAFTPVTSSAAGTTEINYTVGAPVTTGDTTGSGNWLVVSPTGATTTPGSLSFSLRNNTSAGIFLGATATVTLTPTGPSGVSTTPVPITVTYNGTSSGGASTLTATPPSPINLNSAANSQTVTITTNSLSSIAISAVAAVTTGSTNWLSVSLPSNNPINSSAGATITISANSINLTFGATYTGTVTVTPTVGTPLVLNVNFTVGTGGSSTNWSVSPTSVPWNFTTNSGAYPSTTISVATTSGSTTYNVSTITNTGGTWLLANTGTFNDTTLLTGIGVGTPFTLKVGTQANTLSAGQYTGQAIISDSSGTQQATVLVTLNVNGGGTAALTVTPNPISFVIAVNGAQQSQSVNVTSASGGALSVFSSLPAGLTYQLSTTFLQPGVQTNAFTVLASSSGLSANTYNGTLTITVGSQSTTVNVSLVVGGGGTGTTAVAPTFLNFSYQLGTDALSAIARQKLVITGPAGAWSSSVSTTTGLAWLRLSPSSGGALPNPADASQTPTVSIDATGLTAGTYGGTITITTAGGTQQISVSLSVGSGTVLLPTPGSLVFAATTGQAKPSPQVMFFSASDHALGPLALTAASNNSWIAVTNDTTSVTVQVDQTGLTTGVYSGSVAVSQSGAANSPDTIPVVLVVNGGGSGGNPGGNSNVTVSPTSLTFSAQSGSSPAAQSVAVTSASGSASVSFSVTPTTTSGGSWLSTSVASGATPFNNLTVAVNSNALTPGTYVGNILISPAGGSLVNIPVTLIIGSAPAVSASPTTLTFNYRAGDAPPATQQLTVSGGGAAFSATASSNGNWLSVSPVSGNTPSTVSVSVNPAGLSAGNFTGTVLVAGAAGASGSTTVTVTLTVTVPLPTISRVANVASYASGSISPGEIITLFSSDSTIGPATPVGLALDSSGKVATTLGGVQVSVNGFLCPMVFVSGAQVSAVVPYEVKLFTSATVFVRYLGLSSNGIGVNVATTVPGVFTANSSGTGPGSIANSNGSTNSPANPATRGDTVVVYVTGEGETSPAGVTGKVTTLASPPQPLTPGPLLQPTVTIGGQPANWSFAGEAPGFVSGVLQLNVIVPTNIAAGDQPIVVSFGGNPSQSGVTVSVK